MECVFSLGQLTPSKIVPMSINGKNLLKSIANFYLVSGFSINLTVQVSDTGPSGPLVLMKKDQ